MDNFDRFFWTSTICGSTVSALFFGASFLDAWHSHTSLNTQILFAYLTVLCLMAAAAGATLIVVSLIERRLNKVLDQDISPFDATGANTRGLNISYIVATD
jgi:hypothetical protein